VPDWIPGRTWYHVYALGAVGAPLVTRADEPVEHRLGAVERWLDHLADLGVGVLLLGPVFASLTHGYDTVDPLRVDPRLGDETDLAHLIDACHDRDIRILLDGVFNHVSRAFPPFIDVLEHKDASPYRDWFRLNFDADGPDGFTYKTFEGHEALVALNHRSPHVLDWAITVADHWLARGVDGFRLDAAYAVLPSFWSAFTDALHSQHPDAYFVAEMIHGDYTAFVDATGVDSVTQYELWKAIWSACNDHNLFELAWALDRHATHARTFAPLTFVGNHDVARLRTRLADPAHVAHALVTLFTVPGSPCVYYGDEFALEGVKEDRAGGDDAIRPPFPPSVATDDTSRATESLHRELIGLRRVRPWLTTATLEVVRTANQSIEYVTVSDAGALAVVLNLSDAGVPVGDHVRAWHLVAGTVGDALVPPGAWAILEATTA
jgi:cyclomaltodextrinase